LTETSASPASGTSAAGSSAAASGAASSSCSWVRPFTGSASRSSWADVPLTTKDTTNDEMMNFIYLI